MILALDLGNKRVGIAYDIQGIALPYSIVARVDIVDTIKKIHLKSPIDTIVIGVPYLGEYISHQANKTKNFIQKLRNIFPSISIIEIDEIFTTKIARSVSNDILVDDISAQQILETYLSKAKS